MSGDFAQVLKLFLWEIRGIHDPFIFSYYLDSQESCESCIKAFIVFAFGSVNYCWPQRKMGNKKYMKGVTYFMQEKTP